jgi:hypothetical protein
VSGELFSTFIVSLHTMQLMRLISGLVSSLPAVLTSPSPSVIAGLRPDYRCADKVRRRMRRRVRSRVLTSARTATRTFDLQLAIAALRFAPALCRDWNEIRTLPVVYGGNRAAFFVVLPVRPREMTAVEALATVKL